MKVLPIAIIGLLVIGSAYFLLKRNQSENLPPPSSNDQSISGEPSASPNSDAPTDFAPVGKKIAANYYEFNKEDYLAAKAAKRPIYLYFYANWCPTCAKQEPQNVKMFNEFGKEAKYQNLVAFRVNFNDSETDSDEEALAKEFGVTYQHTMFVLDENGKQTKKFLGETSVENHRAAFEEVM